MDRKTKAKIKKYAKLRGGTEPALQFENLLRVYESVSDEWKKIYDEEMDKYFDAIKSKKVMPGESILHSIIR